MEMSDIARRVELGRLLDYYATLLTGHRRELTRLYCEEDMSLAEIAQAMTEAGNPVTRQGVYDALVKSERQLREFESKLGLMALVDKVVGEAREGLAAISAGDLEKAEGALRRLTEIEVTGDGV